VKHILPGPVGYRIDYQGRSVVFTGDTMPTETTLEACKGGVDLLIHESFPSASVFAKKANIPLEQAEIVVNHSHTSPVTAAKVFKEAGARMSAIWHLVVDHDTVGPAYQEIRSQYDGPVTIAQDLTVFNITQQAVITRQAIIDPVAWPVLGK
jgi:ribonuclease Z